MPCSSLEWRGAARRREIIVDAPADRRELAVGQRLFELPPDAWQVLEVLALAVTQLQPRKDSEHAAVAHGGAHGERHIESIAFGWRELSAIALDRVLAQITRDVTACILDE